VCASLLSLFVACASACKKPDADTATDAATEPSSTTAAPAVVTGSGDPFGATFEGELTMHATSARQPPHDITFLAKGDKLRFDATGPHGDKTHAIFEPGTKKVVTVMDAQKMYMEVDLGQMAARALPAAAQDAPRASVTKTGRHEKVAGYDCETWEITQPGAKRTSEACVAQGIAFVDFGSLGPLGGSAMPRGWMEELREKKFFPLRFVEKDETGKETQRMEVTKIEKKKLDDALFAIPAGYRKMEMPTFPAGVPGLPGRPLP
jgi:hypothetical protein